MNGKDEGEGTLNVTTTNKLYTNIMFIQGVRGVC